MYVIKHGIRNIRHEYRRQDQKCPVLMSSLCHMYVTERATFKAFQIVNHICLFRITVLIRTEGKKRVGRILLVIINLTYFQVQTKLLVTSSVKLFVKFKKSI